MAYTYGYTTEQIQGISGPLLFNVSIPSQFYDNQIYVYAKSSLEPPILDTSKSPEENGMFRVVDGTNLAIYPNYYISFGTALNLDAPDGWAISASVQVIIENASDGYNILGGFNCNTTVDGSLVINNPEPVYSNYFSPSSEITSDPRLVSGITLPVGMNINSTLVSSLSGQGASLYVCTSDNTSWDGSSEINLTSQTFPYFLRVENNKYIIFKLVATVTGVPVNVDLQINNQSSGLFFPEPTMSSSPFYLYSFSDPSINDGWIDIIDDGGVSFLYSTSTISPANIPMQLKINYTFDGYNELYILNSGGIAPSFDSSLPPFDIVNSMNLCPDGTTISVNPGDYLSFGVYCTDHLFNNTVEVDVRNLTNNDQSVTVFNMISIN